MELLGVADVAALIDEPEHVVTIACSRFATFIPMVRIGRDRWYPPEAIDVLRVIFDQIRVGVPDEHIETVLTKRFPVTRIASEDLTPRPADIPSPATHAQADRVRDVFDRYQSTIQNEMLQMRREIAQFAPATPAPPPPRAQQSLSELARQESADLYGEIYPDPRKYGFTHQGDGGIVPPIPRPEQTERRAAPDSFASTVDDDTRTLIAAVARQAAASESAAIRQDVDGLRQDVSALVDQFRTFTQHIGMAPATPPRDMRDRRPQAANGTEGAPVSSQPQQPATRLEVVPQDRERENTYGGGNDYTTYQQQPENNGLLGHLARRSPRRMGKGLLGEDVQ